MPRYTYLRDEPTETLASISEKIDYAEPKGIVTTTNDIVATLTADTPTFRIDDDENKTEVPATTAGITAIGNWVGVPEAFLRRCDTELQEVVLNHLLERSPAPTKVVFSETGSIVELRQPGKDPISPNQILDVLVRTLTKNAPVIDWWWNPSNDFYVETVVAKGAKRGWGGEKPTTRRKDDVGDLSAGGLRVFQDRKHNRSPQVQPFVYRMACTNGLHISDNLLSIDGRNLNYDETLELFDQMCERAFAEVEHHIGHFYDLKTVSVANPERELVRLANEARLPERTVNQLVQAAATEMLPDDPTMFDIVNLVTNLANDPAIANRAQSRWALQGAGGQVVNDHALRCGHCRRVLS